MELSESGIAGVFNEIGLSILLTNNGTSRLFQEIDIDKSDSVDTQEVVK